MSIFGEEMVAFMEEVLVILKHMQQDNQILHEFVVHLKHQHHWDVFPQHHPK
jgi:hypothetical protein